jgi:plastocyanin
VTKQAITPGSISRKDIPRAVFMGMVAMLAMLAVLCLAGCGGTAAANSSAQSAKQAAAPTASSQVSSMSGDSMPGMAMPDETAPAGNNANQGYGTPSSTERADDNSGTETVVQAALVEWAIRLSRSEVPAGKIRFIVTNQGTMPHNLTVEDGSGVIAKTPNFRPTEGSHTLEVELKPGTYTLVCTLPGHAKKGQVATFVVK